MTDREKLVRDAFIAVEPPAQLNERTLAYIEQQSIAANSTIKPMAKRSKKSFFAFATAAAAACIALVAIGVCLGIGDATEDDASGIVPGISSDLSGDPSGSPSGNPSGNPSGDSTPPVSGDNPSILPLDVTEATAFITIDINPSIEIAIDKEDRVLGCRGLNADGTCVLAELVKEGVVLEGSQIDAALAALARCNAMKSYLTEDSFVAMSLTCENAAQRERLLQAGNTCLSSLPCEGLCRFANDEERLAAAEAGMGMQRYRAAQELMSLDPSLTWDDCRNMSMRELRDRIATAK